MHLDKIAASKAKGLWMVGSLSRGYDVYVRKLVINETQAFSGNPAKHRNPQESA